ncbi:16S rRNA (cytosine(1402)-N(4))-methyltransferase [Candidatus Peregrinibacteria bacterium HGW-Peregrinibacteria-1]|jgi:16S rRNA (cytosine1402-N4)-methyltransferase|nr:MAG: 16S rRNA (cytosine(1402)-N(4))-methyltransferase [Candidatus Peregrinibacteria bacterium HGW-Peregrinibacteria-1]
MSDLNHYSVLSADVQKSVSISENAVVVDCTLGLGGHAKIVLEKMKGEESVLIGFDQDERNLKVARERLGDYGKKILFVHDNFRYLKTRVNELGFEKVDLVLMDLGISSPHVDVADRGFSFMREGPLDMRFDQRQSLQASDVVNTYSEEQLVDIFFRYGEEKFARKIADRIVQRRKVENFVTTTELAEFIEGLKPNRRSAKKSKSHPATQVFQALRIEVNDEFGALESGLDQAVDILKVGGMIMIITFHSLEDRFVKHYFKKLVKPKVSDPEKAIYSNYDESIFETLTRKPIVPSMEELEENPRSRSAKLRIYKKLKNI